MNLLFVGDVFGSTGREALRDALPELRRQEAADLVVVNCENAAKGAGITHAIYEELMGLDVDFLTSGNHVFDRPEVLSLLERDDAQLVRPYNYPEGVPGRGVGVAVAKDGTRVGIVNLLGRVNLCHVDCPFRGADRALGELEGRVDAILVDFHAETTSEKVALGWYLDGRVSAVIGTHTHVPTADARVLPGGTAYITDAGMTGAMDSVIGLERQDALKRFTTGLHTRFNPATDNPGIDWVSVRIGSDGKAQAIRSQRRFLRS